MGLTIEYGPGQTPIDPDEREGLLLPYISTLGELNEFEQLNIQQAVQWTLNRRFTAERILREEFVRRLHREMYGDVWDWAGEFRLTNKNIGVDKYEIPMALRNLLDDCRFWVEHETFGADEIALRFKHRLVSIHCFPNGNGRHSRLIADVLASHVFGRPVFTWGRGDLTGRTDARKEYLAALRSADAGDIGPLLEFARS